MTEEETMKKSTIYITYEWLWHEVDSGVDYYPSAGGQGVDTSMDHVWTVFQHFEDWDNVWSKVWRWWHWKHQSEMRFGDQTG